MVAEGALENVDEVYGLHNWPGFPRGEVRVVAGDRPALVLEPGGSAFVDPSTPHYRLTAGSGEAEVYRVRGSSRP